MLFNNAVGVWLDYLEAIGRREATVQSYGERLNSFGGWFGERLVGSITSHEADGWLLALRRQDGRWVDHPCTPKQAGKLSAVTAVVRSRCR
jgi:hypothetical protein